MHIAGLPHTQATQRIQGNSGNFQVIENLRETLGILILFLKFQGNLKIFFKPQGNFLSRSRMRFT